MTTNNKYIGITIGALLVIAIILAYMHHSSTVTTSDTGTTTGTITDNGSTGTNPGGTTNPTGGTGGTVTTTNNSPAGYRSYANGVYNFSIKYPEATQPRTDFATFHEIGNNWRLYPGQANQGKSVASFSIYNIDQGAYTNGKQTYPLYFTAEVRVGVSPNVKECYTLDAGYTNQKVTNVVINGVTFKKFSTSDAAMMKYVQAESYRTVHNNMCYVLEQIKNGSSYRDDTMKINKTDAELAAYYAVGETIIKTFKFTK